MYTYYIYILTRSGVSRSGVKSLHIDILYKMNIWRNVWSWSGGTPKKCEQSPSHLHYLRTSNYGCSPGILRPRTSHSFKNRTVVNWKPTKHVSLLVSLRLFAASQIVYIDRFFQSQIIYRHHLLMWAEKNQKVDGFRLKQKKSKNGSLQNQIMLLIEGKYTFQIVQDVFHQKHWPSTVQGTVIENACGGVSWKSHIGAAKYEARDSVQSHLATFILFVTTTWDELLQNGGCYCFTNEVDFESHLQQKRGRQWLNYTNPERKSWTVTSCYTFQHVQNIWAAQNQFFVNCFTTFVANMFMNSESGSGFTRLHAEHFPLTNGLVIQATKLVGVDLRITKIPQISYSSWSTTPLHSIGLLIFILPWFFFEGCIGMKHLLNSPCWEHHMNHLKWIRHGRIPTLNSTAPMWINFWGWDPLIV